MSRESSPDLIVAALPSLEWAAAAVEYGRSNGVPVIVDIRDRWPDSLLYGLPRLARKAGEFVLRSQRRKAEAICRNANALIGTSNEYLEWGLALAGREKGPQDSVVPEGCEDELVEEHRLRRTVDALCKRGIDPQHPICLFSGPFDDTYVLETVIDSAGRLRDIGRKQLQFVFCGDGPKRKSIERRSRRLDLKTTHFLGTVDDTTLAAVASIAKIGLCPYAVGAADGLPGQLFEQMSRRLAVVSSLPGEAAKSLARHECGVTYDAGSINALTNAINRLILNSMLLESLRVNSYATWSSDYQAKTLNARLAEHLASMTFVRRLAA
jgi:glycosyltransferase involved in cell wall biosynthesis